MASDVSRDGSENKRKLDEDEEEGGWVGPLPSEATQTKKKKGTINLIYAAKPGRVYDCVSKPSELPN